MDKSESPNYDTFRLRLKQNWPQRHDFVKGDSHADIKPNRQFAANI
jgi:hypothetical protein